MISIVSAGLPGVVSVGAYRALWWAWWWPGVVCFGSYCALWWPCGDLGWSVLGLIVPCNDLGWSLPEGGWTV